MSDGKDFLIEDGVLMKYTGPGGDVVIPEGVTGIETDAFYYNNTVTSVTIPKSVKWISVEAFFCTSGLTSVTVHSEEIEFRHSNAWFIHPFSNCNQLKDFVTVPGSALYAKDGALIQGTGLICVPTAKGEYRIPDGITEIWDDAFHGCSGLTSVIIPEGVTKIGDTAFANCTNLTSITIPKSVKEIGEDAFYGCTGLTGLNTPEG